MKRVLLFTKRRAWHPHRAGNGHAATLRRVKSALNARGIAFDLRFRGERFDPARYDLVISVGGDGTFLEASHALLGGKIFGVNSDTKHSVGRFTAADRANFQSRLDRLLSGRFRVEKLNRLKITLDGKTLPFFALNEALVCHASPAGMSHYLLRVGRIAEHQRSSGLWIAAAAGSSGAMLSAGGRLLPRNSRSIQYRPRELYEGHGVHYRLKGAVLSPGRGVTVVSRMREGMIFVDGMHYAVSFGYGRTLQVSSGVPLNTISFAVSSTS